MGRQQKKISTMIEIRKGNIADKSFLAALNIDCIVNAASPTLMGDYSSGTVDYAIHNAINQLFEADFNQRKLQGELKPNEEVKVFKKEICKELATTDEEHLIRCKRGQAVLTCGYGLCKYILHVVGARYDGICVNGHVEEECTSSCVNKLESCYESIIEEIKKKPDIKRVAIPIISAGNYGFPYELAVKAAIASIGNALIQWQKSDSEMFHEYAGIEKIYFVVLNDSDISICSEVLQSYRNCFEQSKMVVFQTAKEAANRYIREIELYDKERGYFSVAKGIRSSLLKARNCFDISSIFKDKLGGVDWEKRRCIVEWYAVIKLFIPVILCAIYVASGDMIPACYFNKNIIFSAVMGVSIADTLSYLLLLILAADIQAPSANIIRSMIMLFVNYIEVALNFSAIYYLIYREETVSLLDSLKFGLWGESMIEIRTWIDFLLNGSRAAFGFFFATLVIGYFMGHLRQKQFRN